jgi:hypothetical protein
MTGFAVMTKMKNVAAYRERGQARAFFMRRGCARNVTTQDDGLRINGREIASGGRRPLAISRPLGVVDF